jgi:hypothetical protein
MFMHMLDHVQAESESDPRGASPREYGGPQASSVMDANIVVTNANPGASNHHPWALFTFISYLWYLDVH